MIPRENKPIERCLDALYHALTARVGEWWN